MSGLADDWFAPPSTAAVLLKPYVPVGEPFGAQRARDIILRGKANSKDAQKATKGDARPEIPLPEILARLATGEEICAALHRLIAAARELGWESRAMFARGPWLSADGADFSVRDMLHAEFRWGGQAMCVVTYLRADPKMVLKKKYRGTLKAGNRELISESWVEQHAWAFESAWVRGEFTAIQLNATEVTDWLTANVEDIVDLRGFDE